MFQNYNYYPQQTQQQIVPTQPTYTNPLYRQAPLQNGLRGRLVSSLEEARATSIDFDGSVFYFPDLANKRIYTKHINLDGTATLCVYELRELPIEENKVASFPSLENYVTRDEFERVLAELRQKPTEPAAPATAKQKVEIKSF